MKILCVTNLFPNRLYPAKGVYNWRHCAHLMRLAEVRVISPIPWSDEYRALRRQDARPTSSAWSEWNGVPVVYPRFYYTPGFWRASYGASLQFSIGRVFRAAVAEFRPDIVYACWAYPDGWAAWRLARRFSLPVAVKVHGSDLLLLDEYPGRKRRTIEMLANVDAISAVSDDLRSRAVQLGVPESRTHLIYEGTDRELFSRGDRRKARLALGLKTEGSRILFVGNLVPVKAVANLIEACRRLLACGNDFELDIVGEGPLREALTRQIASLGLTGRIHLHGAKLQAELPDWYRAADLVVLASHSEGVPNVLVEAAACGIPFVATRVGGIPEIAHLSPGGLVPPGDPEALAQAIEVVLRDPAAAAARVNPAAVPSVTTCAEATLNLFTKLVGDRKRLTQKKNYQPQLAQVNR